MSKMPTPRADALRVMREAKYTAEQDRLKALRSVERKAAPRAPAKPVKSRSK